MKWIHIFPAATRRSLTDLGLLIMRLAFGGLMAINHGWPKLQKLMNEDPIKFGDPIGLGAPMSLGLTVFSEFFCGLLLVIGLGTRLASVPLIITMAVAAFIVHGADPLGDKEMALLYLAAYILLFFSGAGRYSVDHALAKPDTV